MRVLVVENDRNVAQSLKAALEADQHSVFMSYTGEGGFFLAQSQPFDLLILDDTLPDHNGIEVLATLRRQGYKAPVLILSNLDAIEDRVLAFDTGADAYIVKPFAFPELLARVRALARARFLTLEDLEMKLADRTVTRSGRPLELTSREYDLLKYLLINKCRVVSREMLARDVWKVAGRYTPIDNVIDAQILRMRRKLDDPFESKLLHAVRGVGFVLRPSASRARSGAREMRASHFG